MFVKPVSLDLQKIEGTILLQEILEVVPVPIVSLIGQLASTLVPEETRTRLVEVGPTKWWIKNLRRCPKLYQLLMGGRLTSVYYLSTITIRLTNLPIKNRTSGRDGLLFVEFQCHLSILTPHVFTEYEGEVYCRHFSRNEWALGAGKETESGTLVRN